MIDLGPLRTALFVPGTRLDRVDKALATAADAVIIDLEDAVPLAQKAAAREAVARLLADLDTRKIIVRVNGTHTAYFQQDIEQVVCSQVSAIMVPKVESDEDVASINAALLQAENTKGLQPGLLPMIALIETARAVDNISQIVRADTNLPGFTRLPLGQRTTPWIWESRLREKATSCNMRVPGCRLHAGLPGLSRHLTRLSCST